MASNISLLLFRQRGKMWGVPLNHVVEIVRHPQIYPMPMPARSVVGLMVYRGAISVTIFGDEIGLSEYEYGIIISAEGRYKTILLDSLGTLVEFSPDVIKPYREENSVRAIVESGNADEDIYILNVRSVVNSNFR